jgi:micrococcal nuclease
MSAMKRIAAFLLAVALAGCASGEDRDGKPGLGGDPPERHTVRRALSGDTIELDSGEAVRYAGIEAPRPGEPFFEEARGQNDQIVVGRGIVVEVRFLPGRKDAGGLRIANVTVPAETLRVSLWVAPELLERGQARIDFRTVPPGFEPFFELREENARRAKRGIWANPR